MNLHGIVSGAIGAVNPFIDATLYRSASWTTAPGGKRTPAYTIGQPLKIQKQALTQADLRHLDNLGIQGELTKLWLNGALYGVARKAQHGGDLVVIGSDVWLVVAVLEVWPDWCSVAVNLQLDATPPGG